MLFLERLGLFHCFRKHKGFFPLRECCVHVLGMGIPVVKLAGFGKGLVAALGSVSSCSPSGFWHCGSVELHQGICHGSVFWWLLCGSFFQVDQRIPTFFWHAWWPNWSHWAAWSEQSWGIPRHFHAVMSEVSAHVFLFPSGGFTSEPFLLTDPSLWGLESQEGAGAHSEGFLGLENVQKTEGSWTEFSEIIFRKSVHEEPQCYKNVNFYFFLQFVIMSGPEMPRYDGVALNRHQN